MTTPIETSKIKEIRRRILEMLDMRYPVGMKVDSLFRCVLSVDPEYNYPLMQKDIYYLKEKGYLEFVDDLIGGFPQFCDKTVKVTANGLERVKRITIDPALEI